MVFLDHVDVRALEDGKNWMTLHEIRYATDEGNVIYTPAGFITDFASVPVFFRRLFQPATGQHRRAAVVHDALYRDETQPYTRKEADLIFLEIMKADGVPAWKAAILYRGVRLGGGSSFVKRA